MKRAVYMHAVMEEKGLSGQSRLVTLTKLQLVVHLIHWGIDSLSIQ